MNPSIVIPAISEERNLSILLPQLRRAFPGAKTLIVTASAEKKMLSRKFPSANVLACDSGFGLSVLAGLRATHPPVIVLDGDLSHSPSDAKKILEIFRKTRPALLIGSRYCPGGKISGWRPFRRFLSSFANGFAQAVLRTKTLDLTSGFRIYSAEAISVLKAAKRLPVQAYPFQLSSAVLLERSGLGISEVPIEFTERKFGRSKTFSFQAIFSFFLQVLRLGIQSL
ncbi:MAG: glycosyltransferase [archaeon]